MVDGTALYKTSWYGTTSVNVKGRKVGAAFSFISTLRRFINERKTQRVIVFWDGESSREPRTRLYPDYKGTRKLKMSVGEENEYRAQKIRTHQYLEELCIRQIVTSRCEADDAIAYYVHQRRGKDRILVITNDNDLLQLLGPDVEVTLLNKKDKGVIGHNTFKLHFGYDVHNHLLIKTICGDSTDNIKGVWGLASDKDRLLNLVPDLRRRPMSLDEVLTECEKVVETKSADGKTVSIAKNVITGKSPDGVMGRELYEMNDKITNLTDGTMISDETKAEIDLHFESPLDTENRSVRNLLAMMIEDGVTPLINGGIEQWEPYVEPFLKVIRHERKNNKD